MPPKESSKKKPKKPAAPLYTDDKGNEVDLETYIGILKRKYARLCKASGDAPPIPQLMQKFRDALEEERLFTTLGLSGLDIVGAQVLPLTQFLQAYARVTSLSFWRTSIGDDGFAALAGFLPGNTLLRRLEISDTAASDDSYNTLFGALPFSSLVSLSFEHVQLSVASLTRLGSALEKFVALARQNAKKMIELSLEKYTQEQEVLRLAAEAAAKSGKKGKKGKKSKKGKKGKKRPTTALTHDRPFSDVFNDFFTLREVSLCFCGIDALMAPSIGILAEKLAKHVPRVRLHGNPLGAVGLGEVGAGLCRAAIALSKDLVDKVTAEPGPEDVLRPGSRSAQAIGAIPIDASATGEVVADAPPQAVGNTLVALTSLDLSNCSIFEHVPEAYAKFGDALIACGNISEVRLDGNPFTDANLRWLVPAVLMQRHLTVLTLPTNLDGARVREIVDVLKEHKRILDEETKKGRKGKKGKKGKKAKK